LKQYCATDKQSLTALRQIAPQIEDKAEVNRWCVKSVKGWKSEDSQVGVSMRTLHGHRLIAEALVGPFEKSRILVVEPQEMEGIYIVAERSQK
jgi:hypothetical protein